MQTEFQVSLPAGLCSVHGFGDLDDQAAPLALVFMDAFGPRPTLFGLANGLAATGCRVLLPDLFYAHAPYAPIEPASLFSGGPDRQRLMTMLAGLNQATMDADISGLLEFADAHFGVSTPMATIGYCMGGRYALAAAALSQRVRLAASFHGNMLAPEVGGGVHERLSGSPAKIYVGVAQIDPTFDAAEQGRLAEALRAAQVDHTIESYHGASHGFVMDDIPAYHAVAAEKHWRRLHELLGETVFASIS